MGMVVLAFSKALKMKAPSVYVPEDREISE